MSEQTRQLVTETLQQVTRSAELSQGQTPGQDGATKDDAGSLAEASSLVSEASQGSAQGMPPFTFPMTQRLEINYCFCGVCLRIVDWNVMCNRWFKKTKTVRSSEAQPVVHVVSSREQDWTEQEVAVESSPTIIYQEVSGGESQSATSTIKALLELQQTSGEPSRHRKSCRCHRKRRGEVGVYHQCTCWFSRVQRSSKKQLECFSFIRNTNTGGVRLKCQTNFQHIPETAEARRAAGQQ